MIATGYPSVKLLFSGNGEGIDPKAGAKTTGGDLNQGFDVDNRLQQVAKISGHGGRFHADSFAQTWPTVTQPRPSRSKPNPGTTIPNNLT